MVALYNSQSLPIQRAREAAMNSPDLPLAS